MNRRDLLKTASMLGTSALLAQDEFPRPDLGDLYDVLDWTARQGRRELSFLHSK